MTPPEIYKDPGYPPNREVQPIPAHPGIDPIWWITGSLTSLLVGFTIGFYVWGLLL